MPVTDMALTGIFVSPHLIDLILLLTALEALVVVFIRSLTATCMLRMLLPGIFLLLALRAALAGTS